MAGKVGVLGYRSVVIVPLQPVPSQTISASLSGQQTTLAIYTRGGALYVDVVGLLYGVVCQHMNLILRDTYFAFQGDLAFVDIQGSSDPVYTGLGSRWLLGYYS